VAVTAAASDAASLLFVTMIVAVAGRANKEHTKRRAPTQASLLFDLRQKVKRKSAID
jgi:hypothetical protein